MIGKALRTLWAEPRPERPAVRVWRDWALVAVLLTWSVLEALLRDDLASRPIALIASAVVAVALLWRRTHPLTAVIFVFGILTTIDVVRILAGNEDGLLLSVSGALVLPYSLFRWGAGREAAIGLGFVTAWLIVTHIADPNGAGEVVAGFGFFLFSAALGASVRFHSDTRSRDIEQAKLRERNQLARELHDAVGHHVSAIAIQAQAGRTLAASDLKRALKVLETIEHAASRALAEMRAMVGVLRTGTEVEFSPQPGVADIEHLAGQVDGQPTVDVHISGEVGGLNPAVEVALYRIAQEAVTNAARHARGATRITVAVANNGEHMHLVVSDDGDVATTPQDSSGYGLVGMAERAKLLGGTLHAGPDRDRGWKVDAMLPTGGASA